MKQISRRNINRFVYMVWLQVIEQQRNSWKMQTQTVQNYVANFIQKTFQILKNNEYHEIAQWLPNGKEFSIRDIDQFEQIILPKYFRHRNINSFIRQLNMYGFHKSRKQPTRNIFSHPEFIRNKPQLLPFVKRKLKTQEKQDSCKMKPSKKNQVLTQVQNLRPYQQIISQPLSNKPQNEINQPRTAEQKQNRLLKMKEQQLTLEKLTQNKAKSQKNEQKQEQSILASSWKNISPLQSFISKSVVMDANPQLSFGGFQKQSLIQQQFEDDENLSIADQIQKERQNFTNRKSGISVFQIYSVFSLTDLQFHQSNS